jgi:16S rRNA (uracil1498-N3)-methyltransferase
VIIGPEGGFDDAEHTAMLDANALPWQLGPRILRTETAGIVALTLLQAQFGDLKPN